MSQQYSTPSINKTQYTRPFENARDKSINFSDDEISLRLGLKNRGIKDIGLDLLRGVGDIVGMTPFIDTAFNPAKVDDESTAKLDQNLRSLSEQAAAQNKTLRVDDLTPSELYRAYQIGYANANFDDKITNLSNTFTREASVYMDTIKKGLEHIKTQSAIAKTPFKELSNEQRQYLFKQAGNLSRAYGRIFDDDDEQTLKDAYNAIKGGSLMQIAQNRAEEIKNFHKDFNLAYGASNAIVGDEKIAHAQKENYLDKLQSVALDLGFDGIDKTGGYFYKTDENGIDSFYKLNEGFFDNLPNMFKNNVGSFAGALGGIVLAGALAKKGNVKGSAKALSATSAAITGSALGSVVGGASDYINYTLRNGEKIDFSTMIAHSAQEGLFSVVGDSAALGLEKLAKKADAKGLFNTFIKEPIKDGLNLADKTIEKFPFLGALTSPVRNFFKDQNIKAAQDLVMKNFTPEQVNSLKQVLKDVGGGVSANPSKNFQFAPDFLAKKYGENAPITQTAQQFVDVMNAKGFKQRQSELLQYVLSDESGKNIGYLIEVASHSPQAQQNIENIVKYSSLQLKNALKGLELGENELKSVFDEFVKGTKDSFDEAMNLIANKLYDKNYKVVVDKAPFNDFLKALDENKIYLGEAEARFKKEIIEPLFDEKGVSFSQLNQIRINLNSQFKKLESPTIKDYYAGLLDAKLRENIDSAIVEIFRQNPANYIKIKNLYDTALKDYAAMKDIQKVIKKANFYKQESDFNDDFNKLMNYVINAKGDEKTPNLERLLNQFTPQNRAFAEINILKQLLNATQISFKKSFENEAIETFSTREFFDRLDQMAQKGNVFKSKVAQDFIDITKAWHRLNSNHADILFALRPAKENNVRAGIATHIKGRLEQMRTNLLMSSIFRLLDKIPFIGEEIWGKTQAGALRFHLKSALANSVSIDDFKTKILNRLEKGNFDNNTKKILRDIANEADFTQRGLTDFIDAEIIEEERKLLAQKGAVSNTPNLAKNADDLSKVETTPQAQTNDIKGENFTMKDDGDLVQTNINQVVKNVSNNPNLALKLSPKMDLLSIVNDFKEPIKTPIFEAKISLDKLINHLVDKEGERRLKYINLIKPTLQEPLFITQLGNRYRFVKTFLDDDKITKFLSVIENDKGEFVGITATPIKNTDLKNLLSKEEVIWGGDTLSALSTPRIAKQEAEAINAIIPQQSQEIKGENFIIKDNETLPKSDYNVKVNVDDWIKQLSEINNNELSANLFILANIHPELFKKPSDVYKLLIEIKNNPTHFFKNNRPDIALIVKELKDGSIGKLGVVKDSGVVRHLTKSTKNNEFQRLQNVNSRELGVGSPYPTQQSSNLLPANGDGVKTHSLANDVIIPQQSQEIKGENFTMKDDGKVAQRNINQTFKPDEWINKLAGVLTDEWRANLSNIARIHPEMFRSEADVARAVFKLLDNKAHFFKNYRDDIALIGTNLKENNKAVNIGVVKENGKIAHINETNEKDLHRLSRRNNEMLEGSPLPSTANYKNVTTEGELLQHSDDIISQKPEISKLINELKFAELNKLNSLQIMGKRKLLESKLNIDPTREFGENYAEFYHDAKGAVHKLLAEKQGQVAGAIHRQNYGDITLAWGESGTGKSDGWGLAKIEKYHSEVFDILDDLIKNLPIKLDNERQTILENDEFKIVIRKYFETKDGKKDTNWLMTGFEKKSKAPSNLTNPAKSQSEVLGNSFQKQAFDDAIISQKPEISKLINELKFAELNKLNSLQIMGKRKLLESKLNIDPTREFGENYAEFYHDAKGAVHKLLAEKQGQVTGAFERKELGDIDLVWGDDKFGLKKILTKHANDFRNFSGDWAEQKIANALQDIINKGEISEIYNGYNIKLGDFIIGIKKGWNKQGDNNWIVTSFDTTKNKQGSVSITRLDDITKDSTSSLNLANSIIPQNAQNPKSVLSNQLSNTPQKKQNKQTRLKIKNDIFSEFFYPLTEKRMMTDMKEFKKRERAKEIIMQIYPTPENVKAGQTLSLLKYSNEFAKYDEKETAIRFLKQCCEITNMRELEYDLEENRHLKNLEHYRKLFEKNNNIHPTKEFGENYAEFYHDGIGAVHKLLAEKQGQVTGAFERKELGDIDLVWGEVDKGTLKGYGLSKIKLKHPEITAKILNDIINNGKLINQNGTRYRIEKDNYVIGLSSDYKGEKRNWIITAFERKTQGNSDIFTEANFKANSDNASANLANSIIPQNAQNPKSVLSNQLSNTPQKKQNKQTRLKIKNDIFSEFFYPLTEKRMMTDMKEFKKRERAKEIIMQIYPTPENVKAGQTLSLLKYSNEFAKYDEKETAIRFLKQCCEITNMRELEYDLEENRHLKNLEHYRKLFEKNNNIHPTKEFGENYAEFYHDGIGAVHKLLAEKQGQVTGAFERKELGDIDLVWGEYNPKTDNGWGMAKIKAKHPEITAEILNDIINNGKSISENGVNTIIYNNAKEIYRVGLSKGWDSIGDNNWIITAYKYDKSPDSDFLPSNQITKSDGTNLHSNDLPSSIIPQNAQNPKSNTPNLTKSTEQIKNEIDQANEIPLRRIDIDNYETFSNAEKEQLNNQKIKTQEDIKDFIKTNASHIENLVKNGDITISLNNKYRIQEGRLNGAAEVDYLANDIIKNLANAGFKDAAAYEKAKFIIENAKKFNNDIIKNDQFLEIAEANMPKNFLELTKKEIYAFGQDISQRLENMLGDKIKFNDKKFFLQKGANLGLWKDFIKKYNNDESFKQQLLDLKNKKEFIERYLGVKIKNINETNIAQKDIKEFDLKSEVDYKEIQKHFSSLDEEQSELANKVLPIARNLGVKVRFALNSQSDFIVSHEARKALSGLYESTTNKAVVKKSTPKEQKPQVLLHELIHSVTSRAMDARYLLNDIQRQAVWDIENIYKEFTQTLKYETKPQDELNNFSAFNELKNSGDYGLKNAKEFVAELSNPTFRQKLKKINLFERIIDAITRLFSFIKPTQKHIQTNAYERTKKALYDIIDNYDATFTQRYSEAKIIKDDVFSKEHFSSASDKMQIKQILTNLPATRIPKKINIDEFLNSLENFSNKENFIKHLQSKNDANARLELLNLIEPTLKQPDFKFEKLENGILKEKRIKKFTDGKEFYYLLATKDKDKTLLTGFKTNKINTILKEFENIDADIIQTFIRQGSKQDNSRLGLPNAIISQKPEISKLINELKFAELNKLNSLQIMGKRKLLESKLNIDPTREFGENYAEFYHDAKGAVHKLLAEKQGQVAGAFERKELGDIDLVWGEYNPKTDNGWGMAKIKAKHPEISAEILDEIVKNGKLINKNGVDTIWYKKDENYYLVGLSQGWKGKGDNKWIITAYEKTKGFIPDEIKGDSANLSAYSTKFEGELTSSHPPLSSNYIIPQKEQNPSNLDDLQKQKDIK